MIDVVGHFGSSLSYATIATHVVAALADRNELGLITNLDDTFRDPVPKSDGIRSTKVLVLSDPHEHMISSLVSIYGKDGVELFLCPNTNRLSAERVRCAEMVGRVWTPSAWCADVIRHQCEPGVKVYVQHLGVDGPFLGRWSDRKKRGALSKLLHVTTDTFWPGRKGTEELLKAWSMLVSTEDTEGMTLTIHCLPQLYGILHQELGDLKLLDAVRVVRSERRGCEAQQLETILHAHDMLVAPSRSEGFGLMPLAALLSGMPVLTTAETGQQAYLDERQGLAGWAQIPTYGWNDMVGEDGEAPVVRAESIADALHAAPRLWGRMTRMIQKNNSDELRMHWNWPNRAHEWIGRVEED